MPTIAELLSQNFSDPNRSDENKYGVDLGKFGGDSDLFTEITNELVEPTKKETYDAFFDIKTREAENEYMKLIGQQGYTKQGQATGFAGSTSQDVAMDSLESAYASSVMDVEEAIGGKMSDAKMAVANTVADNRSTLLQLKQMEQSKPDGKIICSELHRQGYLEKDIYEIDEEYGRKLVKENPQLIIGYQMWAKKVVKLMKKRPLYADIVWFFAKHWTRDMAYKMGYLKKTTIRGRLVSWIFTKVSYAVYYMFDGKRFEYKFSRV